VKTLKHRDLYHKTVKYTLRLSATFLLYEKISKHYTKQKAEIDRHKQEITQGSGRAESDLTLPRIPA
jgi:hypothetical protein